MATGSPRKNYPHRDRLRGKLICGKNVFIDNAVTIDCSGEIVIKDGVHIAHHTQIISHIHKVPPMKQTIIEARKEKGHIYPTKIVIEEDVFINQGVLILPQVQRIGKGAYIGARAVVTKEVPPYEIWAGNPARRIGQRK